MKWKVCGMREANNISEVAVLQPDYMGFIMWAGSKRHCSKPQHVPAGITKVGVFVDAAVGEIEDAIENHKLGVVQLHGNESPVLCRELQGKAQVIKAFGVGEAFDFDTLLDYLPYCDFFLFDTKGPMPGGNGTTFDWSILEKYPFDLPFFISGGIGLAEIDKINELRNTDLPVYAIDINSKFETAPALKDAEQLKKFKEKLVL
jgi:phosphoribosylanthranilate isomerase